jgi:hypothetical protein
MMGAKIRKTALLLPDLSLEALVPKGSFYRRLPEATLDLSFIGDPVSLSLAGCDFLRGHPLRAPARVGAAAERLRVRWFLLGYRLLNGALQARGKFLQNVCW